MISTSLSFLCGVLNNFIEIKDPLNQVGALSKPVKLTNIVDQENHLFHSGGDFIFMTLVNTEEETVGKSQLPYLRKPEDKLYVSNPDIKLNLYIQFSGFSDNSASTPVAYERALILLDQVVYFFQYQNVFHKNQYPELMDGGIEKLIVEPISLTFEQLNHMWATLGAKYLPSVMYKCRMLTFLEEVILPEKQVIKKITAESALT